MIGFAFLSASTIGALSWYSARTGLVEAARQRLQIAAECRKEEIKLIADRIRADLLTLANNPDVVNNVEDLIENLDPAQPNYASVIQAFRAPRTVQERIAYDGNDTNSMYARRQAKVQAVARRLLGQPGYADLLILDHSGRIVYSATKSEDFARSLADSMLNRSGLSRLFHRLQNSSADAVLLEDFAPYPVDASPSAFVGKAITRWANVAMGTQQPAEQIGYVVLRITPALLDHALSERAGLGETGQIIAIGADGRLRSDPPLTPSLKAGNPIPWWTPGLATKDQSLEYGAKDATKMVASAPVSVLGALWAIVAEQEKQEAVAAADDLTRSLAIVAVVVLALTALAGLFLARSIVRPLGALTDALETLAARRSVNEVAGIGRRDEIGDIARAVVTIRDAAIDDAAQNIQAAQIQRQREEKARRDLLLALSDQFEKSVGAIATSVSQTVVNLQDASQSMQTAVGGTCTKSANVAATAKKTSGNVNAVADAAKSLGEAAFEIAERTEQAASMSAAAVKSAQQTEQMIATLSTAATRISDVTDIVSKIAGQTNMLALNATIEAARAGRAGLGFAVVAMEVKALAGATTRATEEISQHISAIQDATAFALDGIHDITQQISAMNSVAASVAAAVEEQGTTTQQIVQWMDRASLDTDEMTFDIAEVALAANNAGVATKAVLQASDALSGQSTRLRTEVEQFLSDVRSA